MFDGLGAVLRASLDRIGGGGRVSSADLDAGLEEIRDALIAADVALPVADRLVSTIRQDASTGDVVGSLGGGARLLGIVQQALVGALGGSGRELDLRERLATILLVGLQGAGKTTTAAKLAYRLAREGRRPLLVSADPRRPAAAEQLAALGASIDIPVHREPAGTAVAEIGRRAREAARRRGLDVLIVDSSGRTTLDDELLVELRELREATQPRERLLVLDAATGQQALRVAEGFRSVVDPTGAILAKIDGDARGGAALTVAGGSGIPVVFMGTGERPEALERFYPDRIARRILDLGDLATLNELVAEHAAQRPAEIARRAESRMRRGDLTFEDLLDQLRQMATMGPIGQIVKMIPGMGGMAEQAEAAAAGGELRRAEAIILSMTPGERRDPSLLTLARRRRIATGAGRSIDEVHRLVKRLEEMRLLLRRTGGIDPARLAGGGGALPGRHAAGRQRPARGKRDKRKGRRR